MTIATTRMLEHRGATISVTALGSDGPTVVLLHGLAGSSRGAIADHLSCAAFVGGVVAVMDAFAPGERCLLVGQSMGAHTYQRIAQDATSDEDRPPQSPSREADIFSDRPIAMLAPRPTSDPGSPTRPSNDSPDI
ncbi:alpha/beta fold hydrolase [Paramicrobacterium fandaimingii]|uniref:alpha/beta fold hydrolase n=1 Tax=Paramicrobacterium fandaimingii TaxID=2708079 RepID=UPI001421FEDA|nr:hypothetical protein [Microbacterium fandaimingii]